MRHLWGKLGMLLQRGNAAILVDRVPSFPAPAIDRKCVLYKSYSVSEITVHINLHCHNPYNVPDHSADVSPVTA